MIVVGVGHRARNGKDYFAKCLRTYAPFDVEIYSFATALKAHCRVMGWMTKKDGPLLQYIGTELYRQRVDDQLWVKCLRWQLEEENPKVAVIPDMRFPNEFDFVKGLGGITVKVERIMKDGSQYIASDRPANHPSEIALSDARFDVSLRVPDGALDLLQYEAGQVWKNHILPLVK